MKLPVQILAIAFGSITALGSILFFVRLRWPAPFLWFAKLYLSALSPLLIAIGMITTIVGFATGSLSIVLIGSYCTLIYLYHVIRVTRPPNTSTGFDNAFGMGFENKIKSRRTEYFLKNRLALQLPVVPNALIQHDIPFAAIPGTSRQILCDLWQPSKEIAHSGLAFIYLHGSAFYFLDKDFKTRPFFHQLAAQGHVIMDVAYRLFPETDIMGMVNDVKRAIAWMKEHAESYGVNPDRIVVGGGSAGGHLALLSAYTALNPAFTPAELQGKNLEVSAVISMYGSSNLEALYYHTNQHLTTREVPNRRKKSVPTKMPAWIVKKMGSEYHRLGMDKGFENVGTLPPLMGGHPDECPERYNYFSVVKHVHSNCPPTLLIHGEHDIMAPVISTRELYSRLTQNNVPTVMHIFPQTEHGFDFTLPKISPSAHNAIYDVELFLSYLAHHKKSRTSKEIAESLTH